MNATFTRRAILHRAAVGAGLVAAAASLLPLGASAALAATDVNTASRFSLTVDGYEIASYTERLPAPSDAASPTMVFRRPKSSALDMWAWHEAARTGLMARQDLDVVMFDSSGKPVARYHLENAWVPKIEIGALKSGSSEVLMETVTLVAERIQRVSI